MTAPVRLSVMGAGGKRHIEHILARPEEELHQLRARAEKRERSVAQVEFRPRGAAIDIVLLWVCACAIVLAGLLHDSIVRNSEICRDRFNFPMPTEIPTNRTAGADF
jgi:hypothetical protein